MTCMHRTALVVAVVLLTTSVERSASVKVQFYGKINYRDFLDEFSLNGEQEHGCFNIPMMGWNVSSIKTNKCIMVYADKNCTTLNVGPIKDPEHAPLSERFDQDTPNLSHPRIPVSFHVCSQKLGGGPQLDIDFYQDSFEKKDLLRSYRGVCGCTNIPKIVRERTLAIDNHGNGVNFYPSENCQSFPDKVPAGDNYLSRHFEELFFTPLSFQPKDLKNCYRLTASITKFHFQNGTDDISELVPKDVPVTNDSEFSNDGASEITQTFKVASKITETVEFSVAESFTKTETASVSSSVSIVVEAGIPLFATSSVTTEISGGYEWSRETGGSKSNATTVSVEREISIEQQIKIPPCKKCVSSTYVKQLQDFPVKYTATARISAGGDDADISAEEIKKNLPPGMDYVRDIDGHSVEVTTEGIMYVEYGLKTLIDVKCNKENIEGCSPPAYDTADDHQVYEFPIPSKVFNVSAHRSRRSPTFLSFLGNALCTTLHLNGTITPCKTNGTLPSSE